MYYDYSTYGEKEDVFMSRSDNSLMDVLVQTGLVDLIAFINVSFNEKGIVQNELRRGMVIFKSNAF